MSYKIDISLPNVGKLNNDEYAQFIKGVIKLVNTTTPEKLGNVSDVLLNFYHFKNQHNTRELPYYFPLYTIEISVFQAYKTL